MVYTLIFNNLLDHISRRGWSDPAPGLSWYNVYLVMIIKYIYQTTTRSSQLVAGDGHCPPGPARCKAPGRPCPHLPTQGVALAPWAARLALVRCLEGEAAEQVALPEDKDVLADVLAEPTSTNTPTSPAATKSAPLGAASAPNMSALVPLPPLPTCALTAVSLRGLSCCSDLSFMRAGSQRASLAARATRAAPAAVAAPQYST